MFLYVVVCVCVGRTCLITKHRPCSTTHPILCSLYTYHPYKHPSIVLIKTSCFILYQYIIQIPLQPYLQCVRNDKLSALRLSQVQVLTLAIESTSPEVVQDLITGNMKHVNADLKLLQLLVDCTAEEGYKNIAAAGKCDRSLGDISQYCSCLISYRVVH